MLNRRLARVALSISTVALLSGAACDAWAGEGEKEEDHAATAPGLQLGARVAYAFGSGDVYSGLSVSQGSNGALPLIVDAGIRILPELYVGLYGQWAHVFARENAISCPAGYSCTVNDWRFGVEVDYHFKPRLRWDPYVGLGGGYEILHTSVSGPTVVPTPNGPVPGTADASITDRGWEFVTLTLGFDARLYHWFGVGPFFSASLNEYGVHDGTQTVTVAGTVTNVPVANVNHDLHELYIMGVRGTFNL
jgi:hypothetical protein